MLKFTLCVLASLLIAGGSVRAQDNVVARKKIDLAQMRLENVQIERESIAGLFSALSFTYNIPVGLEIARSGNRLSLYRIDFHKGTLSDLLAQFVAQHEEYTWQIENGVVSVFPKEDHRDPVVRELLLTRISSFSVPEKTSCWHFGQNLLSTPETKRILERYGTTYDTGRLGGFYIQQLGQKFSFEVSGVQLKSILDKAIKESPVARNWSISNKTSAQKIFLEVHAEPEYQSTDSIKPE
ncbi:MAG TPA: hypothetical protein VFR78_03680 [Pyrinomonadaceae bacterium]|nr:hypothetical protein [Pyrinomonadaceae bacterium]